MGLDRFTFNIKKYDKDTKGLSLTEHGAYNRLLTAYYAGA